MPAINVNTLLEEAKCYTCLGLTLPEAIELALLSRIAQNGADGGAVWGAITGTLSNQADLQAALDAKASNDFRAENYGGVAPSFTPTGSLGIGVDTVTEQIWWYYAGSWH